MMTEQDNNVQWRKVKLGDCLKQKPDYGINAPAVPYDNNLPTYLRITDITEDGCYSKKDIVSVANQAALKYVLEEGDLVFARTGASVGKTYLYDSKDGMLVFAGFLIRVKTDENVLLPEFFKYQTHTPQYKNWIAANSMRTGQPGINGNEYEEFTFSIPFKNNKPDLSAQRRIAAILSSADKVIDSTRRLIEKYKQMKQGMMEDLLKPKEGWKMVKLGEVGEIVTGSTPTTTKAEYWDGEYNFYSPADFGENAYCTKTDRTITAAGMKTGRPVPANSIMVACIASIGKIAINITEGITNQQINTIIPNDNYNFIFLYYLLSLNVEKIKGKAAQTTIPIINKEDFSNLEFRVPDLPEQRRIAAILSVIDAKIAAEEKVLEKYEKVKKGLMERMLGNE